MSSKMRRRGARGVGLVGGVALIGGVALMTAAPASAGDPRESFVVVLNASERPGDVGRELARRHGGDIGFVYEHALKGFSLRVPARAADAIARDGRVASIERDQLVSAASSEVPTGVLRSYAVPVGSDPATAVGNTTLDIDGADDNRVDVDIAIIDSGIAPHPDLNVVSSTNCSGGSPMRGTCTNGAPVDGNGHGTHVAGTAAALDNGFGVVGVAPGARLHAVKVLNDSGSGYTSWIVAGIDWVTAHNTDASADNDIEVANMSLGGAGSSDAQARAIAASIVAGTTYAVAAGNSSADAQGYTPANVADVITVSALADFDGLAGGKATKTCGDADLDDTLAGYSNWGTTVEIAAPGSCIRSTWPGGGYNTISGTSMATPHVAGAAAVLAASPPLDAQAWTPARISATLQAEGNVHWTDDALVKDGKTEPLLDLRDESVFAPRFVATSAPAPVETAAPVAAFTYTCSKLQCSFSGESSTGTGLTYAWDFGDGSRGGLAKHVHTYGTQGSYTVVLTVTDDKGRTSTSTKTVRVKR